MSQTKIQKIETLKEKLAGMDNVEMGKVLAKALQEPGKYVLGNDTAADLPTYNYNRLGAIVRKYEAEYFAITNTNVDDAKTLLPEDKVDVKMTEEQKVFVDMVNLANWFKSTKELEALETEMAAEIKKADEAETAKNKALVESIEAETKMAIVKNLSLADQAKLKKLTAEQSKKFWLANAEGRAAILNEVQ